MHNKRIKFAHCVRPTRNGEAPLLAAYARRWVPMKTSAYGLAVALILAGCVTGSSRGLEYRTDRGTNSAEIVAALDKAEALWNTAGITSYSMHIRRGGVFGGSVFTATYRAGSCRAKHLKDIGLPSSFACEENSIPQLRTEVRKEIMTGQSDVSLSLDPELGYIRWFFIEPHTNLTDQGWGVEVSDFRALR